MIVPLETLEEIAVEEISKATRQLIVTDWSPEVEADARRLLGEMQAQCDLRGPAFRACVDEYEAELAAWRRAR